MKIFFITLIIFNFRHPQRRVRDDQVEPRPELLMIVTIPTQPRKLSGLALNSH